MCVLEAYPRDGIASTGIPIASTVSRLTWRRASAYPDLDAGATRPVTLIFRQENGKPFNIARRVMLWQAVSCQSPRSAQARATELREQLASIYRAFPELRRS